MTKTLTIFKKNTKKYLYSIQNILINTFELLQWVKNMPKMKTKSGAKKRFKVTASGRVKSAQAGKRHGMIKRSSKFIRNARGTTTLCKADENIVKSYMPYSR